MADVQEIPERSGVAFRLAKGQRLTVIDPRGVQVADLLTYNADDVDEVLSSGRTLDYAERWDPLESTCRHASLSIL